MRKLNVKQAAKLAMVHPQTIRFWARNGIVPDRRIPGTKRMWFYETDFTKTEHAQAA